VRTASLFSRPSVSPALTPCAALARSQGQGAQAQAKGEESVGRQGQEASHHLGPAPAQGAPERLGHLPHRLYRRASTFPPSLCVRHVSEPHADALPRLARRTRSARSPTARSSPRSRSSSRTRRRFTRPSRPRTRRPCTSAARSSAARTRTSSPRGRRPSRPT